MLEAIMQPLVSIGLPIYNEERFVAKTLDSLLAQDYLNFEIIISDNASTDRTSEICESYAKKDSRIRYFRNDENVGLSENTNRAFAPSKGKYFMLIGGHDLWDAHFISACILELERDPNTVVAFGCPICIDLDDRPVDSALALTDNVDTRGLKPADRLCRIAFSAVSFWPICGILRSDAWRKCAPFFEGSGPDLVMLAKLSLEGEFHCAPSALFYFRTTSVHKNLTPRENISRLITPESRRNKKWIMSFPFTFHCLEMSKVVARARISFYDKLRLMHIAFSGWWRVIAKEFIDAVSCKL